MNRMALRHPIAAILLAAGTFHSLGNPTGGQVTSGAAAINSIPGTVTINQTSNNVIINWDSFSIASGELTKFVQPSPTSAALNRVLGGGTSNINGTLSANGRVILMNGNGIVVGAGGMVNAYGFLATTRDIADSDFLNDNLHFTGSNSAGVQNLGTIIALGDGVGLFGKTADNKGTISAPNGTVALASGDDILLNLSGEEHVFVSPTPTATPALSQTAVNNSGAITAASAELKAANGNLFALAINNEGTIRATTVTQHGGRIFLTTDSGLVQNTGTMSARMGTNGGIININGGSVWNRKTIDASGATGGSVTIHSQNIQNDGAISAQGTSCNGGTVALTFAGNAVASVQGLIDASGATQGGSIQFLGTSSNSEAYLSLTLNVNSSGGLGGSIGVDSSTFYLTGATLTANGATGGGRIFLGEGDSATSPALPLAQTAYISLGTSIQANATSQGNGGTVGVVGTGTNEFHGKAEATGAGAPGTSGIITFAETAPSGSSFGSGGGSGGITINLGVGSGGSGASPGTNSNPAAAFEFVDPDPAANNAFGRPFTGIFNLTSNTTLITSPGDSFGGADAGAVYLFSDTTGALLSTLRGNHADDAVGTTIQTFTGGNFAVLIPDWNNNTGAVTFGNGSTGFVNGGGAVSATNSLIGSTSGDMIGSNGLTRLPNGNYLVLSPNWNANTGAVTLVNPAINLVGVVGSANSLTGAASGDQAGSGGVTLLNGNGDYVVSSPNWNNQKGAVTWASDTAGIVGAISPENSLVGTTAGDKIGSGGVTALSNGNFLVVSPDWAADTGAVTLENVATPQLGAVGAGNSLVGATPGDEIGSGGVLELSNDANYLVLSPSWNGGTGAVTNASDATGITGLISDSNSLIGNNPMENVGRAGSITDSGYGYYFVRTTSPTNGPGAVTWSRDTNGTTGIVNFLNSLTGPGSTQVGDGGIVILSDGNFLILTPDWGGLGAVTWGSATSGVKGFVGVSNSLVGATSGDDVGSGGIVQLNNGANYLVLSPSWGGGRGAVTNGSMATGVTGPITPFNSLVGSLATDGVGASGSITQSYSGYYLATTTNWGGGKGAVTWNSDNGGTIGAISASNSLVGGSVIDHVGSGGETILTNGNYVVDSQNWSSGAGAVTWGSSDGGISGVVSESNSLIGAAPHNHVGDLITALPDGNYLVTSPRFASNTGAVTWANGTTGLSGTVSETNSLMGSTAGDSLGSGGIQLLSNEANYLVLSPLWDGGKGAITNGSDGSALIGTVSSENSLVGETTTDGVGASGSILDSFAGYYLVKTPHWGGGAGAVTWNIDRGGTTGEVSATNSLVGSAAGDHIGSGGITILYAGNDSYVVDSPDWNGQTGAVTWGSTTSGVSGFVSSTNSLVGMAASDHLGSGGIVTLTNGDYLVLSPLFNGSAGAVTWGSDTSGVNGQVTADNSIIGGGPDAGEEYAGQSADGSIYLVAFTTDTSAGGDGRIFSGSVNGPFTKVPTGGIFQEQPVLSFEVAGLNLFYSNSQYYISDPDTLKLEPVSVDALSGGALNDGKGGNIASGSSTAGASGPKRLVTPGNGTWNIFAGTVHSTPPPLFVSQQLQLNLSPEVLSHLHELIFGNH